MIMPRPSGYVRSSNTRCMPCMVCVQLDVFLQARTWCSHGHPYPERGSTTTTPRARRQVRPFVESPRAQTRTPRTCRGRAWGVVRTSHLRPTCPRTRTRVWLVALALGPPQLGRADPLPRRAPRSCGSRGRSDRNHVCFSACKTMCVFREKRLHYARFKGGRDWGSAPRFGFWSKPIRCNACKPCKR